MKTNTDALMTLVADMVEEVHPGSAQRPRVSLDSQFDRDLGLDSLGRMELIARIEAAFSVAIPESALARIDTPRDLMREVQGGAAAGRTLNFEVVDAAADRPRVASAADAKTLLEVLQFHADSHGERTHIRIYHDEHDGELISYQRLLDEASVRAAGLQSLGVNHGDAVVLMLPSGPEYFFSFFGVLLAGGIPVPVYPPGNIRQLEEHLLKHAAIVDNAQACVMVVMEEAADFARIMQSRAPTLRHLLGEQDLAVAGHAAHFNPVPVAEHDIAFIQYTSGSTGMPKGVVLTHANLVANVRAFGIANGFCSEDVFVSWLPLYHDMGLIGGWFGSLYHGSELVIMPPLSFVSKPLRWLLAIHRFRGTISAGPNFAYEQCLRRITDAELEQLDLSSWRCACNGAEAVRPQTIRRFSERFAACGFRPEAMRPVYGLAESSVGLAFPAVTARPTVDRIQRERFMSTGEAVPADAADLDALEFVFCGQALPGHQIRIADEHGQELPDRTEGRIQFKGPSSTSGYYRNPIQTAALFDGDWLNTGDRGYIVDGQVVISGRTKDIVIKAGRNIYPEELELAIAGVEGVVKGNVAVFGTVDEQAGTEQLVVMAETRRRDETSLARIQAEIQQRVTDIAGVPADHIELARPNTVLKTSSGKIRRDACRVVFEDGQAGRKPLPPWAQVLSFRVSALRGRWRHLYQRFKDQVFAAWAWTALGLMAFLTVMLALLLPTASMRMRVTRALLRTGFRLARYPLQVDDRAIAEYESSAVFVANHASYLDALVMMAAVPRPVRFVAKGELRTNLILHALLGRLGVEFVERFDEQQTRRDAERLKMLSQRGVSVFFFAEGTFTRMPGLLPFRMGAFDAAISADVAIVPVVIRGTRSALRDGTWMPRRVLLRVQFGDPIRVPESDSATSVWSQAVALRDRTRSWILERCGEPDLGDQRPELLMRPDRPAEDPQSPGQR